MMHFQNALAKKLNSFAPLSSNELLRLSEARSAPVSVRKGRELLHEGQLGKKVFIVLDGWASSYKDLRDGTRQIISFSIAGDCVGLRGVLLETADHSFSASTDAEICTIDAAPLMQLFQDYPRIRAAFLWSSARDEAMTAERLVDIGRRTASQRIAHFFVELSERLMLIGLADPAAFDCPLSQYMLADALGLSAIHVNRVLRDLRERNLLVVKCGKVTIVDLVKLTEFAGYQRVDDGFNEAKNCYRSGSSANLN